MLYITENSIQELHIPKFVGSDSDTHTLKIHSEIQNKDLEFEITDLGFEPNFYVFHFDTTALFEGENVYDIDGNSCGLIIKRTMGIPDSCTNIQYDAKPMNTEYFVD